MTPKYVHYPRTETALHLLDALRAGLSQALLLAEPLRSGKTSFLLRDLTPEAERAGYRVVYINLSRARSHLAEALQAGLAEAIKPVTLGQRIKKLLGSPVSASTVEFDALGVGVSAEMKFEEHGEALAMPAALGIEDKLSRVLEVNAGKPLLLLIDGTHHLLGQDALAHALRGALEKHRDRVRVVFASSEVRRAAALFSSTESPFYGFAQRFVLPPLGNEYVRYMVQHFNHATGRTLGLANAMQAFEASGGTPGLLHEGLRQLALQPGAIDLAGIVRSLVERNQRTEEAANMDAFVALEPLQRVTLMVVAVLGLPPYAADTMRKIEAAVGRDVSAQAVHQALRRLAEQGWILRDAERGGHWRPADPRREAWLRAWSPGRALRPSDEMMSATSLRSGG